MDVLSRLERAKEFNQPIMFDSIEVKQLWYDIMGYMERIKELKEENAKLRKST